MENENKKSNRSYHLGLRRVENQMGKENQNDMAIVFMQRERIRYVRRL